MRGDDEVRLAVLVDEARGGLQPLPAARGSLQAVGDQTRRASLQH